MAGTFPRCDLKQFEFYIPEYEFRHLWCQRGNCFSNLFLESPRGEHYQRMPHIHISDLEFWIQIKSSVCDRSLLFTHRGVFHCDNGLYLNQDNVEQFICSQCCEIVCGVTLRYPAHIHQDAFPKVVASGARRLAVIAEEEENYQNCVGSTFKRKHF